MKTKIANSNSLFSETISQQFTSKLNTEGNTPLHLAVKCKPEPEEVEILTEMLLTLLDIGADPKLENKNGQTPVDSCETDAAHMILSEKRGLISMNVDVGDVSNISIL